MAIGRSDPRRPAVIIRPADFAAGDLKALMATHLEAATRQDASHAYSLEQIQQAGVHLFEARATKGALMGVGGLKRLDDQHAEIKSMRTHPDHLRKGVSRALMGHLEAFARAEGITRLSLETHPTPAYTAARALYEALGFAYCGPFADYGAGDMSVFMTKRL